MTFNLKEFKDKLKLLCQAYSPQETIKAKSDFMAVFLLVNNESDCSLLLEQIFAFALVEPRAYPLLEFIERETMAIHIYDKPLEQFIIKMIESNPESRISGEGARPIRCFLVRQLLRLNTTFIKCLLIAKSNLVACEKILTLLVEYFDANPFAGNLTDLIILLMQLVEAFERVPSSLLQKSLKLLRHCVACSAQLSEIIFEKLGEKFCAMFSMQICPVQSLPLLTLYLRWLRNKSTTQATNSFMRVFEVIKTKYVLLNEDLSFEKKKIANHPLLKLQQFEDFFASLTEILTENYIETNQEMKCLLLQLLAVRTNKTDKIISTFVQMRQFDSSKQINLLLLKQVLAGCLDYHLLNPQARKDQQLVIDFLYDWVNQNISDPEIRKVRQSTLRGQDSCEYSILPKNSLEFFCWTVRKNIEDQFQFQFDCEQVESSTNLLCYLREKVTQCDHGKEDVLFFIKLLLNLNESCEAQYKPLLVQKIINTICVYAELLMPHNNFLREVVEAKLAQRFPSSLQKAEFLLQKGLLTPNFATVLFQRVKKEHFFFNSLKKEDIGKACEIILKISKTEKYEWPSDEWLIMSEQKGVQLYGKDWVVDALGLEMARKRMAMQPAVNDQDLQIINQLIEYR